MSLRTTPEETSTLGPLEPSPGYGPGVSAGAVFAQAASAVVVDAPVDVGGVVVDVAVPDAC